MQVFYYYMSKRIGIHDTNAIIFLGTLAQAPGSHGTHRAVPGPMCGHKRVIIEHQSGLMKHANALCTVLKTKQEMIRCGCGQGMLELIATMLHVFRTKQNM